MAIPLRRLAESRSKRRKLLEKTQKLDAAFAPFSRNNLGVYVKTAKELFSGSYFFGSVLTLIFEFGEAMAAQGRMCVPVFPSIARSRFSGFVINASFPPFSR